MSQISVANDPAGRINARAKERLALVQSSSLELELASCFEAAHQQNWFKRYKHRVLSKRHWLKTHAPSSLPAGPFRLCAACLLATAICDVRLIISLSAAVLSIDLAFVLLAFFENNKLGDNVAHVSHDVHCD